MGLLVVGYQILTPVLDAYVDFERHKANGFNLVRILAEIVYCDVTMSVHGFKQRCHDLAVDRLRYVVMLE